MNTFCTLVCTYLIKFLPIGSKIYQTKRPIFIGGPRATAGHRKYPGILEKFTSGLSYKVSIFSQHFGQKIRHNSTIQWQVQFACLSALVLGRSVDRTWGREHGRANRCIEKSSTFNLS